MDHDILVGKRRTVGVKPTAFNWIIDFLKDRKQRVSLMEFTLSGLMFLREFPRGSSWPLVILGADKRPKVT